ncbi:ATP-dependent DNA helicase Snf21 [Entomophthora muscae]|uniref:ATP-dependent DNA helicase Snf21 n=1 Tax=Entomophthora muscae TaxID=34485 RepID=A0ACC2SG18_9FUNG|nr:ATP-dependent DNA helicase Snf21 [Entomophthora muscae]
MPNNFQMQYPHQLQYPNNQNFSSQPINAGQYPFATPIGIETIRPAAINMNNSPHTNTQEGANKVILSQEQLKKIFNRLTELKKEGAPGNNSQEYKRLLEFLKDYSQSRNVAPGPRPSTGSNPGATPSSCQATTENTSVKTESQFSLSANHLQELAQQISEFKYLSKNLPVPSSTPEAGSISIKQEANPVTQTLQVFETLREKEPLATKVAVDTIFAVRREDTEAGESSKEGSPEPSEVLGYLSPFKMMENSQAQLQRLIVPSITPLGLDPYAIAHEREERLKARVQHRIRELEALPSNLSNGPLSEDLSQEDKPHSTKLKAVIELKALKLLGFQKKLREDILRGASHTKGLAANIDRNNFRRMKRQTLREARHTERLEKQQRVEREKREKQKHTEFLASIVQHGKDLLLWHKNQQAKQARIGRMVLQFHNQIEKEEQRRIERLQKQRLELLRTGNEQEYLKLIDQAKDTRISLLLQQTDGFLKSLAKSVLQQQNDHSYYEGSQDKSTVAMEMDGEFDEDSQDADYYSIAHRIKEEITVQPSILVGGTLKDYQLKGLQWMVSLYNNRLNGILADEMGLGKTIQTISLITYLIEFKHLNGPFLVLVPLSTVPNWAQEFNKWAPSINKVVYKGSPAERKELQKTHLKHNSFQVLVTTFEYIIRDKAVLSKIPWMHMIIDEGHRMKNSDSKLSVTLNTFYSFKYRLILTGTPLQNNLPELWSLLNFVLPRIFNSVTTFDEWFNTPFTNSGGQDRIELNEEEQLLIIKRLHKVLRPFLLRRLKKDVESELPDKVEKVVKCQMSALQQKIYYRIQRRVAVLAPTDGKGKSRANSLNNTIMQLRKACNHPFVFPEVESAVNPYGLSNDNLFRVSGKFELLDRILPKFFQTGHRVLIFFQMTTIMTIFEDYLTYRHIKYLRLDGTTKQDTRANQLSEFNNPDSDIKLFMLSTRAGGLGLNLQTADTVVIFDSDWNPHQDLQAQDRAHRIGQKKKVLILRLITANTVEEKILERAQFKLDIDGKVIQAGKFDNKSTAEEREALLRSLLEGDNVEAANADEELNDEDMNDMIARSEEERILFNEMDRVRVADDLGVERLMQEHELPQSLLTEPTLVANPDDDPANLGRGRRAKDIVMYDDGLTEEQYVEAIEGSNDINEVIKKKFAQRQKREERRQNQDSPDAAVESIDTPPRKRSRPGRKPADSPGRSRKSKSEDSLPLHVRVSLNQRMLKCILAMEELLDPYEPTRRVCALFERLPSRREYPDYYSLIKNPISIKNIRQRIRDCEYQGARDLHNDCMVMFNNARFYNEESSEVYSDANLLEKTFMAAFEENFPPNEGHIKTQKPSSESENDGRDKPTDQSSPVSSSGWNHPTNRLHVSDDYD